MGRLTAFIGGPLHRRFYDLASIAQYDSVAVRVPMRGAEPLAISDWENADGERMGRYDRVSRETTGLGQLALASMYGDDYPPPGNLNLETVMVWMGWAVGDE